MIRTLLVIVIPILCLCNVKKPDTSIQKESLNASSSVRVIAEDGTEIAYDRYGLGDTTLLFVHGWCINRTYWKSQVEHLKDRYAIVTMDLPGFGQSGKNRNSWTIENYGKDVLSVINQLQLKNIVLIGHSMGGDVILEAALKSNGVIALIGVDNFKDVGMVYSEEMEAEFAGFMKMLRENYRETVMSYARQFLFLPSSDSLVVKLVLQAFQNSDSVIAVQALDGLMQYAQKEPTQLTKLNQKLYLINSDATPTYIQGLDSAKASYEILDIHATGHYPMVEKPGEFNDLLDAALSKISRAN